MNRQVKCEWGKPARTHRTHLRGPGERSRGRSSSSAGQVLSVGQQASVPSASTSIAGAAASCSPGTTTHPSRSRRETLVCGHRVNAVFRLRRLSFLTLAGGESTSVFLLPTPRSQPRSQTRQWCASRLLTALPRGAYYRCSPLPAVPTSIVSCSIYSTALYELVITQ